jgi:hypothetical protein
LSQQPPVGYAGFRCHGNVLAAMVVATRSMKSMKSTVSHPAQKTNFTLRKKVLKNTKNRLGEVC